MNDDDLLSRLRKELEHQHSLIVRAQVEARQLQLAISAIEADDRSKRQGPSDAENSRSFLKRGELKQALLDCLRHGIGHRKAFGAALRERGIETTSNSISNALNRMSMKREICWDPRRRIYVLNEEGPNAGASGPL